MGHSNGFPSRMLIRGGCPQYEFILQDVQLRPSRIPFLFTHSIGGEEYALFREPGKADKALTPSQVNYKAIVSGKAMMKRVLGSEGPAITPSLPKGAPPSSYEKSDLVDQTATSKVFLDLTSDMEDAPQPSSSLPKVSDTSPQYPSPIQGIWYPGLPSKSAVPRTSHHSPDPSVGFMPIGSEEGYKSGHPYFVDTPYVLPSGGREELRSNHTATEGKLAYELETTKANSQKIASDLEKCKDELARVQSRLEGCMVENEDLHSRLSMAENSATTAIEDFKKYVTDLGEDYVVELFDDLPDDEDEDLGADDDEDGDEDNDVGDDGENDAEEIQFLS
ncbi:hypothetical protein LIER_38209 [Lithospermum erythrorhizon]|uniref:Uncharacterized protein n=1 Tax=Lithospermum erythrorhizon TaxID=34254 RepID=A0AAV3PXT7_LITER